jgi:hypothetical protein
MRVPKKKRITLNQGNIGLFLLLSFGSRCSLFLFGDDTLCSLLF